MSAALATDKLVAEAQRKRLENVRAALALKGFELVGPVEGPLIIRRWNLQRQVPNIGGAEGFALSVGARL